MELILEQSARVDGFPTLPGAGWVATLDDEARDKSMKYRTIIVAIETELKEVAGCDWCLLCEKLEEDVAGCGVEEDLSCGLRLKIV